MDQRVGARIDVVTGDDEDGARDIEGLRSVPGARSGDCRLGTASRCSAALLPSVMVTTARASAAGVSGVLTSSMVLIVPA